MDETSVKVQEESSGKILQELNHTDVQRQTAKQAPQKAVVPPELRASRKSEWTRRSGPTSTEKSENSVIANTRNTV